jgi:hypothetical protein
VLPEVIDVRSINGQLRPKVFANNGGQFAYGILTRFYLQLCRGYMFITSPPQRRLSLALKGKV